MAEITNPTAAIVALSEGFVLKVGERTIACTTLDSLARAVKSELDRGKVVQMPQRPSPQEVRAALSSQPIAPVATPTPALSPVNQAVAGMSLAELTPQERAHFYQICQAWVDGKLPDKKSLHYNLQTYCPTLDPHAAELALAEYVADHRADDD